TAEAARLAAGERGARRCRRLALGTDEGAAPFRFTGLGAAAIGRVRCDARPAARGAEAAVLAFGSALGGVTLLTARGKPDEEEQREDERRERSHGGGPLYTISGALWV